MTNVAHRRSPRVGLPKAEVPGAFDVGADAVVDSIERRIGLVKWV